MYDAPLARRTNILAVLSLIVPIVGLPTFCCGGGIGLVLFGAAGAVLGYIARNQIRSDPTQSGDGVALAGLIVGSIVAGIGLILLLASIALIAFSLITSPSSWMER
jgi:hypothetical protein